MALDPAAVRQCWAAYRTGVPLSPSWPGCVGAVRQPLGETARDSVRSRNAVQRAVLRACALLSPEGGQQPAIFFQEALHGADGDTIFPSPAALGSTWEPLLLQRVMEATALAVRALGSHLVFAPVLDLFVDGRFGRLQEGFGEDPAHVAAFARAAVLGLQGHGGQRAAHAGRRPPPPNLPRLPAGKVYAVAKHFVGYGASAFGLNGAASLADERSLLEDHLRPWRAFVAAGGAGAMAGHHAALGVPCHANELLLRGVLRTELGLPGPIVSDCNDVGGLVAFRVAPNRTAAAALAMSAGIDLDLQCGRRCPHAVSAASAVAAGASATTEGGSSECGAFADLPRAVAAGLLPASAVQGAVARVKALKAAAGVRVCKAAIERTEGEAPERLTSPLYD